MLYHALYNQIYGFLDLWFLPSTWHSKPSYVNPRISNQYTIIMAMYDLLQAEPKLFSEYKSRTLVCMWKNSEL